MLFGASNLTLSLPVAADLATGFAVQGGSEAIPTTILAAHGPGRSYGVFGSCGLYGYPGLIRCNLIRHARALVKAQPETRCFALLTDIGNDILLTENSTALERWLRTLISELKAMNATIAITDLPLENVRRMPAWKFKVLRRVFFPFSKADRARTLSIAEDVHNRVVRVCSDTGVPLLPTRNEWYGPDHFHLKWRYRETAFAAWLGRLFQMEPLSRGNLACSKIDVWRTPLERYRRLWWSRHFPDRTLELRPNVTLRCF